MSDMAEKTRAAARSKARKLSGGDPHAQVDASGYKPDSDMENTYHTGLRPVTRERYRAGGAVEGEAPARADRKARKSGGALTAISLVNRDVKEANKDREGPKHDGGFKRGGTARERAHKMIGGSLSPQQRMQLARRPMTAAPSARPVMARAQGGKTEHADEAQDRKLVEKMLHEKGCKCAKCGGGRVERASGGGVRDDARLASSPRNKLIASSMRAAQKAGVDPYNSSPAQGQAYGKLARMQAGRGEKIPARAAGGALDGGTRPKSGRIARAEGGRTRKGKGTTVNIVIGQHPGASPAGAPPPMAVRPPMPPGAPLGLSQAPPPQAPMVGMSPQGAPAVPPVMRRRGGRAGYPIDAGAGSGLGRLEKAGLK